MTFGLSFDKIILIGVIAVLIIGPDKLPQYAASFAQLLNKGRDLLKGARTRVRDEMVRRRRLAQTRPAPVRPAAHHS